MDKFQKNSFTRDELPLCKAPKNSRSNMRKKIYLFFPSDGQMRAHFAHIHIIYIYSSLVAGFLEIHKTKITKLTKVHFWYSLKWQFFQWKISSEMNSNCFARTFHFELGLLNILISHKIMRTASIRQPSPAGLKLFCTHLSISRYTHTWNHDSKIKQNVGIIHTTPCEKCIVK